MKSAKYFDRHTGAPIDVDTDGCALSDWNRLHGKAAFAIHPDGFRVFLPPETISAANEYTGADPYAVEENVTGAFHARRIKHTVALVAEVVSSLDGRAQILDVGCGQGHITDKVRSAVSRADFTGIDYSISAIAYAHRHFPGIDFAVGDAYELPYAAEFFDVVVCNNLWEHLPDPLRLLGRVGEILKPGGFLILSTPSRYRLRNLVRVLRGKPVVFMSPHHVTEYTVGQVIEQLAFGGFEIRKVMSDPIRLGPKLAMVRWPISIVLSLVGSHHQLESTVFYLARKIR